MSEIDEARIALDMALAEWDAAKRLLAEIQISEQVGSAGAALRAAPSLEARDETFKEAALRARRAEIATAAALQKLEELAIAAGISATPNEDRWRNIREATFDRNQIAVEIAEYLLHGEPIPRSLLDAYEEASAAEAEIVLQSAAMVNAAQSRAVHDPASHPSHAGESAAESRHVSRG